MFFAIILTESYLLAFEANSDFNNSFQARNLKLGLIPCSSSHPWKDFHTSSSVASHEFENCLQKPLYFSEITSKSCLIKIERKLEGVKKLRWRGISDQGHSAFCSLKPSELQLGVSVIYIPPFFSMLLALVTAEFISRQCSSTWDIRTTSNFLSNIASGNSSAVPS